jgi:hypothetical protein
MSLTKNVLIFLSGGISLIAAVYGWDYYTKHRDTAIYQKLGEGLSQSGLRDSVLDVESYKLIFGFYPSSIEELRGNSLRIDPASDLCGCSTDYFYLRTNDEKTYYLFSKGRDCVAFTSDDLYPVLTEQERKNIGLRIPPPTEIKPSTKPC